MTSRRNFLRGATAIAAAGAFEGCAAMRDDARGAVSPGAAGKLDPHAIGVISDVHTGMPWAKQKYRTGREYPWQPEMSSRLVKEILALPNPPANVICLGDISLAFGEPGDYELAADVLKPLYDAGIKVTIAMGNHDIRAEFIKAFPGYDKTTRVPGRFVSVVETPHADFILLDSLAEPKPGDRGKYKALEGCGLGDAQRKWVEETLPALTKPTFVCAHHMSEPLKIGRICAKSPKVVGYLHGHHHHWMTNYIYNGYSDSARTIRCMGFPSLGLDRDVGWGLIRTTPEKAILECKARDFYFPVKRPAAERPPSWDAFVRDWDGRRITFEFDCVRRMS